MAHLISLPTTPFEKTRGRKKIGKGALVYSHAREIHSKDVKDHGTEAMAQPKSKEHGYLVNHPA